MCRKQVAKQPRVAPVRLAVDARPGHREPRDRIGDHDRVGQPLRRARAWHNPHRRLRCTSGSSYAKLPNVVQQRIIALELSDHVERIEPIDQSSRPAAGPCPTCSESPRTCSRTCRRWQKSLPALLGRCSGCAGTHCIPPACCRWRKRSGHTQFQLASVVGFHIDTRNRPERTGRRR